MMNELRYPDASALSEALANRVAADLGLACLERGRASLVVSGGRSPAPFLENLSRRALPWEQIWVTLTDERWVDPEGPDSNQALVHRTLLQNAASRARFVPLKNEAPTPLAGEPACQDQLSRVPRPFDLVVLGMGEDGHTASLFPRAPQLEVALQRGAKLCIAIDPVTAPHPRLSLTLGALLSTRRIALLISGKKKWDIYQLASQPGPERELPIRAILQQREVPVDVYWSP
jgi:6-phosphogluconolactonase